MPTFNILSLTILSQLLLIIFAIRIVSLKKDSFIWLFLSFFVDTFFGSVLCQQIVFSQYIKDFTVELPELLIAVAGIVFLFRNKTSAKKINSKAVLTSLSIAFICVFYTQFIYAFEQDFYAGLSTSTLILIIALAIFSIANYMGYILLMQRYALGFLLNIVFFLQVLIFNGYYLVNYPSSFLVIKFVASFMLVAIFSIRYIKNKKALIIQ